MVVTEEALSIRSPVINNIGHLLQNFRRVSIDFVKRKISDYATHTLLRRTGRQLLAVLQNCSFRPLNQFPTAAWTAPGKYMQQDVSSASSTNRLSRAGR